MINRFDVEKYLGEDWKKFRNGETWDDIGLFMDKIREDIEECNYFKSFAHDIWLKESPEIFGEPFIFWLFTPERFCKIVIKFLERDKSNEQDTTS